jgi:hypothetical protein
MTLPEILQAHISPLILELMISVPRHQFISIPFIVVNHEIANLMAESITNL